MRSVTDATVFLMAQGPGSRWRDRQAPWSAAFDVEAPPYKQLLTVNGEPIIVRSARLFAEAGFSVVMVASQELLDLAGMWRVTTGLTLENPGDEILTAYMMVLDYLPPDAPQQPVFAMGDVLFSRESIRLIRSHLGTPGVLARVEPSKVCRKVADEVFACWYPPEFQERTAKRIASMTGHGGHRPGKPWGQPHAILNDLDAVRSAYAKRHGLSAIRNLLVTTSDYTDDIDSPTEWTEFWDDLRAAAEAEG